MSDEREEEADEDECRTSLVWDHDLGAWTEVHWHPIQVVVPIEDYL